MIKKTEVIPKKNPISFTQTLIKGFVTFSFIFSLFYCIHATFVAKGASYDLRNYLFNAKFLLNGQNIYSTDVYKQVSALAISACDFVDPFDVCPRYPPSCYSFLAPFTLVNWITAKWLWLLLNLILTCLLAKEISTLFCSKKHFLFLLVAMVCSIPWRDDIYWGQNAIWSLCFFILSLRLSEGKKPFFSGLALALALYKYSLTLPMCFYYLVYKRVWKNVLVAFGFHLILNGLISVWFHQPIFYFSTAFIKWCSNGIINSGEYDLFAFWALLHGKPVWIPYLISCLSLLLLILVLIKANHTDDLGVFTLTALISSIWVYHCDADDIVFILAIAWILERKTMSLSHILFSSGISLIAFLKYHYFTLDYLRPFQQGPSNLKGLNNILKTGTFPWTLDDLRIICFSFFWYFSIGILGYKLIRRQNKLL